MPTNPPPESPDPRAILRELAGLIALVIGLAGVVAGAFIADPGLGVAACGAVVAGGGIYLGRS